MESKMQDHCIDQIFEQMKRFEDFYLSIPDVDESLIEAKENYFVYKDGDIQLMWLCFRRGAGV